jgi:uncharacterized protein
MGFEASATPAAFAAAMQAAMVYCGLLILLGVALAVMVTVRRRHVRIGLGTGEDRQLLRYSRIHGNFIEQVALGLPLLIALPLAGAPALIVHGVGLALLVGRIAHAIGLLQSIGTSVGRVLGMMLSWTALAGGAPALIIYALSSGGALRFLAP